MLLESYPRANLDAPRCIRLRANMSEIQVCTWIHIVWAPEGDPVEGVKHIRPDFEGGGLLDAEALLHAYVFVKIREAPHRQCT